MSFKIFHFIFIVSIVFVSAKVIIIPDQILEDCTPQNEIANVSDFSELELIPENDTHTFLNGKWKFVRPLRAPWKGSLIFERYERGQWHVQAFNRKYKDCCQSIKSPLEPVYDIFKNIAGCPMEPGTAWEFNMVPITFPKSMLNTIPSYYMGRWRAIFFSEFEVDGEWLKECRRVYADMFED